MKTTPKILSTAIAIFASISLVACVRPYNTPKFEEIKSNETAFLVPLQGANKDSQTPFLSEDYLSKNKIAAKRITIPKEWVQTGRWSNNGEYMDTMRVIKVDRTPITRQWSAPEGANVKAKGSAGDMAIWVESSDSVGFSMGFSCSAFVAEENAPKFLYQYSGNTLAIVMDTEVRARIQQNAAEVAAKYKLDDLRSKKMEIVEAVRKDCIEFFAKKGVTITTLGMFGGMTYENPDIQNAIDKVFVQQQEKNTSAALLEAQKDKNERMLSESKAMADSEIQKAEGRAKAIGIEVEALAKAQSNPLYLNIQQLNATKAIFEKWDGKYPYYYIGSQNVSSLLALPSAVAPSK